MGAASGSTSTRLRALLRRPPRQEAAHHEAQELLKDADELYLATDEDREGEAIAWHLLDVLKPKVPVHRMVFHEITKEAIRAAVANPREINMDLVEAQEARRILDRLYGYEVSPVLWKKVMPGLSAGRVQSVATRLVVDRERERMRVPRRLLLGPGGHLRRRRGHDRRGCSAPAALRRRQPGWPAAPTSARRPAEVPAGAVVHLDRTRAEALVGGLRDTDFAVRSVESKPYRRSPYAPFRTTTLQQEASRKLGFGAARTMSVAQRLYENGFITYMRTDSTTLSDAGGRGRARPGPRAVRRRVPARRAAHLRQKVKNAQEAHEAIRPAGDPFRTPAQTGLTGDAVPALRADLDAHGRLADEGRGGQSVTVRLGGAAADGRGRRVLRLGRVITFHGFLKAYVEGADDGEQPGRPGEPAARSWPRATPVDRRGAQRRRPRDQAPGPLHRGHPGQGAGGARDRPPLDVRLDHRHDPRPRLRLQEGHRAGAVLAGLLGDPPAGGALRAPGLLRVHRGDGGRPRRDRRRAGARTASPSWREFYFGSGDVRGPQGAGRPSLGDIDARELATFPVGDADSGINLRVGRYGPYLEGPDDEGNPDAKRANVPDDLPPDELTVEKAKRAARQPGRRGVASSGTRPGDRPTVVAKNGRYGPYVTEVLPEDAPKKGRPSRAPARCSSRCRWTRSPSRGAEAAVAAARGRHRPRGASRSPRRTAATART